MLHNLLDPPTSPRTWSKRRSVTVPPFVGVSCQAANGDGVRRERERRAREQRRGGETPGLAGAPGKPAPAAGVRVCAWIEGKRCGSRKSPPGLYGERTFGAPLGVGAARMESLGDSLCLQDLVAGAAAGDATSMTPSMTLATLAPPAVAMHHHHHHHHAMAGHHHLGGALNSACSAVLHHDVEQKKRGERRRRTPTPLSFAPNPLRISSLSGAPSSGA